jgi:hypothetical protein
MHRFTTVPLALAATLAAAGCATTTFSSIWKAPDAPQIVLSGQKVAAVVMTPNNGARRAAEDALARELTKLGASGVASYTFLSDQDLKDEAAAKTHLQQAGVAGVVVMRVASQDQSVSYSPSTWSRGYYPSFGGYWGYGWGAVYSPGYIRTDTIVNVETLVYSLTSDKLLWAAVSGTTNPSQVDAFVTGIVDEAAKEMRKSGLLPTQWEQH